jgi:hypothetical protein
VEANSTGGQGSLRAVAPSDDDQIKQAEDGVGRNQRLRLSSSSSSPMQGTYIPETNNVPRKYSVAAILLFLFMVHTSLVPVLKLLHFYISTIQNMCAVANMAVFCSSLTSWFPGMLLMCFLNYFEIVPVARSSFW